MKNPLQISWRTEIFAWTMLVIMVVLSGYFYNNLPDLVPIHWNLSGAVDGWSSKIFATFFLPILIIGIYGLMLFLPQFDVYKENYKKFNRHYHGFKNILVSFLVILYFLANFAAMGYNIAIDFCVPYLIGLLFVLLGWQMRHLKRNSFLGLRTAWSLSSDKVWDETHHTGGFLFMMAGILMASTGVMPLEWRLVFFILTMVLLLSASVLASYYYYRRNNK